MRIRHPARIPFGPMNRESWSAGGLRPPAPPNCGELSAVGSIVKVAFLFESVARHVASNQGVKHGSNRAATFALAPSLWAYITPPMGGQIGLQCLLETWRIQMTA